VTRKLLDTNIILHLVRRSALAELILKRYQFRENGEQPLISVVTVGEVYSLAYRWKWGERKLSTLSDLLDEAMIIPLEYAGLTEAYARIDAHCRNAGRPIGENDCWIAATAAVTGAILITTDSDFNAVHPLFLNREWIDPKLA
jgi:tRNA(fMet)-specific endonuclease VapC